MKAEDFIRKQGYVPNSLLSQEATIELMEGYVNAKLQEAEDKAIDFYLWMNANNYDHNIRRRVEKKYEIFKRNGAF